MRLAPVAFPLAVCLRLAFQAPAPAPDPIEGKWSGMVGFPQDRVPVALEFKRDAQGEIVSGLYLPVCNFYGLDATGPIHRDGKRYVSKVGSALSLTLEDGALEGTFTGLASPISLRRADSLPVEAPVPDLPKGPGPLWQTKLGGSIYATAALRDGTAYVGTTSGVFQAIDTKDGSLAWTFAAGRPMHGEALATDAHVYFVCDSGFLYKLDRKTGKEAWRYDLGDAQSPRVLRHPAVYEYDSSAPRPVLAASTIYVGSGDGGFHAVDAESGKRVWRVAAKDRIRGTALVDGERVIFGSFDGVVYAIDRTSGREAWRKDLRGPVTTTPALIDGKLVVGNRNSVLYALSPATGEVIWRAPFWGSWVESEPVACGGLFCIGASDLRRVTMFDPKDGRVVWRTDVFGWSWGRPAISEKLVFAGAAGGTPYLIRHVGGLAALDRETGRIAWRWPIAEPPGELTYGFAASPAIDGKTLVIGGIDGTLYAFPAG